MSNRYKGAIISATPPTTTGGESGVASGAWTLEQQMQLQAAGLWPLQPTPKYIEDVFSCFLYTGNGTTQTITNGIDLSTYGGMVWLKPRSESYSHKVYDTIRGGNSRILTNTTDAASTGYITSFNSNGFSKNYDLGENTLDQTYVSWTFREQPKFFDVVTYTGDGTNGRQIAHNLQSTPGFITTKSTSTTGNWVTWHRSYADTTQNYQFLNLTSAVASFANVWGTQTSTYFTVGTGGDNASGVTYVAYLFAHDAGGFGPNFTDNVISCGSYTGNGSTTGPVITLGYEPQWLMVKKSSGLGDWVMVDSMRGIVTGGVDPRVWANLNSAENTGDFLFKLNATGFQPESLSDSINASGSTYIYIAIRRGPMAVPTDGTKVFSPNALTTAPATFNIGFPLDLIVNQARNGGQALWGTRLQGPKQYLDSSSTAAEVTAGTAPWAFDKQNDSYAYYTPISVAWNFRRAPSFFDEVCWTTTQTGFGITAITHNLGVVPELIITKARNTSGNWMVRVQGVTGNTSYLRLNSTDALTTFTLWGTPTTTTFSEDEFGALGGAGTTAVAYLFATCAGVSKVGSYTGTGTTQTINCGFTGGARFVLIKRTDSTGDWYVWDSARGIIAGNDPYLLLNSAAAEVTGTDYVDTAATGFEISSTAPAAINANGGTFIFLAIA
jgi:hypothetical protein